MSLTEVHVPSSAAAPVWQGPCRGSTTSISTANKGDGGGTDSSPEREHNPSSEVIVDLGTRLVGRQGMVLEIGKDGSMVGVVLF